MSRASDRPLKMSAAMDAFLDELPIDVMDDPAFPEVLDAHDGEPINERTRVAIENHVRAAQRLREMRGE